jgi:hypothetical protein
MSRPTKWTPELEEQAWEYVYSFNTKYDHAMPSIEGLALILNTARSTIYLWAKDSDKEFSYILERVMDAQAFVLPDKGLKGEFNSTITKLMLTKHGYADKADVNTTKSPANDMTPAERVARLETLLSIAEEREAEEEAKNKPKPKTRKRDGKKR